MPQERMSVPFSTSGLTSFKKQKFTMVSSLLLLVLLCTCNAVYSQYCPSEDRGKIRLSNGTNSLEGRVEVCLNGVWCPFCIEGWDQNDVNVTCRQIGRELGVEISRGFDYANYFYMGEYGYYFYYNKMERTNVSCTGSESNLIDCPFTPSYCPVGKYAGVVCIPSDLESSLMTACATDTANSTEEETLPPFTCPLQFCRAVQGTSFSSDLVCNGLDDCGDCSDECHCYNNENSTCRVVTTASNVAQCGCATSSNYEFQCDNGLCVTRSRMCDGVDNCGDCSDECRCRDGTPWPKTRCLDTNPSAVCNCNDEEFKCSDGYCIDEQRFCDSSLDCRDGSDETGQRCLDFKAESRQNVDRNANRLGGAIAGGVLGSAIFVMAIWLGVLGICCVVPFCPLRKTYSYKAASRIRSHENAVDNENDEATAHDEVRRSLEFESPLLPPADL